ncbi:hypothetical protein [Mangrovivirga cuniculi]|uniref:Uncharacterized protein n=1 Tax=Mangrovivirga cuniculi TaxID=2715131 RepID=A0A4D7JKR4_9BACT|nr:hypothetical protein [Mangrovivirga cuniculi]QCK15287.1 hypothetical protein DCC35_11280 [Mangrovivirga cuniculi]
MIPTSLQNQPKKFLLLLFFFLAININGQEILMFKNIPIELIGDGVSGYVDFRARAGCMGEPRIQMAVDRIVIDGVTVNGKYYTSVDGFDFPITVPNKGNLYLKGSIPFYGTSYSIRPGSISGGLNGFLDWVVIEDGEYPHQIKCDEWKKLVKENLRVSYVSLYLRVYKEDNIGDGIFRKIKSRIEKLEKEDDLLHKLERDFSTAEDISDYRSVISAINNRSWTEKNRANATSLQDRANSYLEKLEEEKKEEQAEIERQEKILNEYSSKLASANEEYEYDNIIYGINSEDWNEKTELRAKNIKEKASLKLKELQESEKEENEEKSSGSSGSSSSSDEKETEDEQNDEEEESDEVKSESTYSKTSCEYLEEAREKLRTVQYRGQEDIWRKEIARLEPLCDRERSRATSGTIYPGTDSYGQSSESKQERYNNYQRRVQAQNDRNLQTASAMGASSMGVLYLFGSMIYQGMGNIKPKNMYTGANIYNGIELGYTATGTPFLFDSHRSTMDYSTGNYVDKYATKADYAININLRFRYKLGFETDFIAAYGLVGGEAGFSPLFETFNYNYLYGGRGLVGLKVLRGFVEYTLGSKTITANGWLNSEELGKGKTNFEYEEYKYGVMFSWYGGKNKPARNHIAIGLIEQRYTELGEDVVVRNLSETDDTQRQFFDDSYLGYLFEWKHDHHGMLTLEVFPKYPYSGVKTSSYDSGHDFDSEFYINFGYVRTFDWW